MPIVPFCGAFDSDKSSNVAEKRVVCPCLGVIGLFAI